MSGVDLFVGGGVTVTGTHLVAGNKVLDVSFIIDCTNTVVCDRPRVVIGPLLLLPRVQDL